MARSDGDAHAVLPGDGDQLGNVRGAGRDFAVDVGEELGGPTARAGDRDHLAPAGAEAKAVDGARGQMHERSGARQGRLVPVVDLDVPSDDIEGLVPVVAVRGRTAPFGALLEEDLVAVRYLVRGEHGDLLADHVEGTPVIRGTHDVR